MRILYFSLAMTLACGGCDLHRASGLRPVERDSAGIRIVEGAGHSLRSVPWRVGPPVLALGTVNGPPETVFSRVAGALRLPDGRVVVADGSTGELRFFAPDGRFLSKEGGKGAGPGEFEYLRSLDRCGPDGITAFDIDWARSSYTADGAFVNEHLPLAHKGEPVYNLACDDSGHFVVLGWGQVGLPRIGSFAAHDHLLLVDSLGAVMTDFGDWLVSERIGSATGSRPHPFGRATVFAIHRGQLYAGTGENFEVRVFSLDGNLRTILRGPTVPLAVTDSLRAAYLDAVLARTSDERRPATQSRISEMTWPDARPAYTALFVDSAGVVWLREFSADPSSPERWALLDGDKGYLGDLSLEAGQRLLRPELGELLVLANDDLGVEHVLALPLIRDASGS